MDDILDSHEPRRPGLDGAGLAFGAGAFSVVVFSVEALREKLGLWKAGRCCDGEGAGSFGGCCC